MEYIRSLPITEEDKYLLIGQHIYGYTQEELSKQLGVKPATLRKRSSRLMKRVRDIQKKNL